MEDLEKLKHYIIAGGFNSQVDLALFLGVDGANISEWKTKKHVPKKHIQKLEKEFGIIEKDGDTIKFIRDPDQIATHLAKRVTENAIEVKGDVKRDTTNLIPVHHRQNIDVAGGYGALNDDESAEVIMVPEQMLRAMFGLSTFENLDIINVTGDSMKPIVEDGDTIMVRRTNEVKNNQVAIVRVADQLYIKYFQRHALGKWVKLSSADKEHYPDMDFEGDEVNEIQVIGVLVGKFKPY